MWGWLQAAGLKLQACDCPLQALGNSLNGLGLYGQSPGDLYSAMLPTAPVAPSALLDGLASPDPYMAPAALMPNIHAVHAAAALQQVGAQFLDKVDLWTGLKSACVIHYAVLAGHSRSGHTFAPFKGPVCQH